MSFTREGFTCCGCVTMITLLPESTVLRTQHSGIYVTPKTYRNRKEIAGAAIYEFFNSESDCSALPRQRHINILHVVVRVYRFQKRFHFFALGITQADRVLGTVA